MKNFKKIITLLAMALVAAGSLSTAHAAREVAPTPATETPATEAAVSSENERPVTGQRRQRDEANNEDQPESIKGQHRFAKRPRFLSTRPGGHPIQRTSLFN